MKLSLIASLSSLIAVGVAATMKPAPCPYPNELPNYSFCEGSKWKALIPLESTIDEVLRVLGEPIDASDLGDYTAPYPGHRKARAPVFTFDGSPDWEILIYFVKSDAEASGRFPKHMHDRLLSIDLLPRKRLSFKRVIFPGVFKKKEVFAADAAWDEYSDGTGLRYLVYTSRTPYGDEVPGDLNRISYGASDKSEKEHGKQ